MPVSSTDGKRLFVIGVQPRSELLRFDTQEQRFQAYFSNIRADQLNFSRDGQWVAYILVPEGTLWRSKVDGSGRLQLSYPPLKAAGPRWSPDGQHIAFRGISPGKPQKIYVVSVEGGNPGQLMAGNQSEFDPSTSSD